jgi:protein O-mannosyl-transferase
MTASSPPTIAQPADRANASPVSPAFRSPDGKTVDRQTVAICLALLAAVIACYLRVTRNGFIIFDDNVYIVDNPVVRAGLSWATLKWAFTTYAAANWHPLTWISHALDCQIFGLNPIGHHWVNVLLHGLNAVLLFLLLQRATGFRWRSLMVAALFAVHPINVESVAWAAERKNVLSMTFFLLTFHVYGWYARQPDLRRYGAVAGLFGLALLAKPQVITLPFLLLLWDYWPLARAGAPAEGKAVFAPQRWKFEKLQSGRLAWKQLAWEKVPLLLFCAISGVLTMQAQSAGGAVKDFSRYGPLLRLETAVTSYVRYMGKALWPSRLVALYPHPTKLYPVWQVAAALLLLVLITALVLGLRDRRYLAAGWFWFLGSLIPMIGLVQVGAQSIADRYAYISFLGLFVMVVWLVGDLFEEWEISARWLVLPAVSCLLALGVHTYRQVSYWHDTEAFWRRTLALSEDNYAAHKGLATVLYEQGKTQEALAQVREALAIRPEDPLGNMIIGDYEHGRGHLTEAAAAYQMAADHAADDVLRGRSNAALGYAYREMGDSAKAKHYFETSLRFAPNQPPLMVQLGLIDQLGGDTPAAIRQFALAMKLQPTDVGLLLLANALLEEGGHDKEANALLERAAGISKNIDEAEKQAKKLLGEK